MKLERLRWSHCPDWECLQEELESKWGVSLYYRSWEIDDYYRWDGGLLYVQLGVRTMGEIKQTIWHLNDRTAGGNIMFLYLKILLLILQRSAARYEVLIVTITILTTFVASYWVSTWWELLIIFTGSSFKLFSTWAILHGLSECRAA